jgi:hypothetical protein
MQGTTNSDYDWDGFDTDSYYTQYKGSVIFEDRCLTRAVMGALLELNIPLKSQVVGIDVGNGGVLRGPSLIAPFVRDDGVIVWSDYGEPQLKHAREIIAAGKQGNLGNWAQQQTHMGECHSAWSGAALRSCRLGVVRKQSIFELPESAFDIAITCFVPESLTGSSEEWEKAVGAFLSSVKPGHPAVMLFMVGSTGYGSAGTPFPAVPVDENKVRRVVSRDLSSIQSFFVEASHGARPEGDSYGYEGMGAVVGIKK